MEEENIYDEACAEENEAPQAAVSKELLEQNERAEEEKAQIAERELENLRERAKDKFSTEEIDKFIKMAKVLCSKAVLSALICVIREGPEKGFDAKMAKKLVAKIETVMPYNYCGFTQVAFREIPHLLNISLSLVPRDYKTEIDVLPGYEKDLFSQYNFLKQTAIAYWAQFREDHAKLYKMICEYRSDVDFSALVIDPNNVTTMYIDPLCAKRVGVFCYYVDKDGNPFYKKKK
jgi:uncharacterized protein (UPF0335 family)